MIEISSTGQAPVSTFLDALAARQSTPGGGGAAALTGSQAAALVSMVINFTIGAKRYAGVQEDMQKYLVHSEELRSALLELADRDVEAFQAVSACYGMPKSTDDEKAARTAAMQSALKTAAQVPFETAQRCLDVMRLVEPVGTKGNVNVVSDAAAAMFLAIAAFRSALVNVDINLKFIRDEDFVQEWTAKRNELASQFESAAARAKQACEQTLEISL